MNYVMNNGIVLLVLISPNRLHISFFVLRGAF